MHLIITDPWFAKQRAVHFSGLQLFAVGAAAVLTVILASLVTYHLVFVHGVRQGWPVATTLANLLSNVERQSQERYLRENLDVMATRLGEMQARVVQLDALAERLAVLAGLPALDSKSKGGAGGVLVHPQDLTMVELGAHIEHLSRHSDVSAERLAAVEGQLFLDRVRKAMLPTASPVKDVRAGSGFGWRIDPMTGQSALHTGLDFAAEPGTPILAAAGGVVVVQEFHPAYGHMVEIDHGKDLVTRYAHASRVLVKSGDIVKRGQHIADVGSSGRSTGPHLHFEVWLAGAAQDPQLFLDASSDGESKAIALQRATNK
jgi:murein DD-endopeptidase MepM/ murein hydrolase activator NlpD